MRERRAQRLAEKRGAIAEIEKEQDKECVSASTRCSYDSQLTVLCLQVIYPTFVLIFPALFATRCVHGRRPAAFAFALLCLDTIQHALINFLLCVFTPANRNFEGFQ